MNKPLPVSLRDIRKDLRAGVLHAEELVGASLNRARRRNHQSHAYISLSNHAAIEEVRALAGRETAGPLFGIPYACKDVFDTTDMPTTAGSLAMADYRATQDALAIQRLRASGAILIGKTNLHEFSYGITGENAAFGTPPNPYDDTRIAGGSSSGSAVAVAQGSAVFALGTDTGGSIRVPAALCGLVGLKPTMGLIEAKGVIPFCWSLDHVGLITRCCADASDVLQVLAGREASAERLTALGHGTETAALQGLRIGVPRPYFFDDVDPEIGNAVDDLLLRCRDLGSELVALPAIDMAHVRTASLVIQLVEAFAWHKPRLKIHAALYGEDVRDGLLQGQFILAEHYVQALRFMEVKRLEIEHLFQNIDVIVAPTTPIVAPRLGARIVTAGIIEEPVGQALTRFTCLFNLTGNPCLSVPVARNSAGLPIGLQLIGPCFADRRLLTIGQALEQAGLVRWHAPDNFSVDDEASSSGAQQVA
ncbi:amidase [Labrys okinawensis]|uniref:amidase n=1 Tax=Labrys okinawensis TaxID=346911 RepID=UPI0039BC2BFE